MESNVFDSIMTGLNEATEDAKSGKPLLKRHKATMPARHSEGVVINMRDTQASASIEEGDKQ